MIKIFVLSKDALDVIVHVVEIDAKGEKLRDLFPEEDYILEPVPSAEDRDEQA